MGIAAQAETSAAKKGRVYLRNFTNCPQRTTERIPYVGSCNRQPVQTEARSLEAPRPRPYAPRVPRINPSRMAVKIPVPGNL